MKQNKLKLFENYHSPSFESHHHEAYFVSWDVKIERPFLVFFKKFKLLRRFYKEINCATSVNSFGITTVNSTQNFSLEQQRQYIEISSKILNGNGFLFKISDELRKKHEYREECNRKEIIKEIAKDYMKNYPKSEIYLQEEENKIIKNKQKEEKRLKEENEFIVILDENKEKGKLSLLP